jgi:ribose-phosphate pyrophosphokinase
MQTLNLINYNKSDIKYQIINFPDGEPHIKLGEINRKHSVQVHCRICNPNDLFILLQVGDILNRQGVIFSLRIYYLMSMRMDRVITFEESFSLKVVADLINNMNPSYVLILEPHSEIVFKLIENCSMIAPPKVDFNDYLKVFPDEGAMLRYRGDEKLHVICNKIRDPQTGRLTGFKILNPEVIENNPDKPFMVIDDLCDGGGTFAGIASLLDEYNREKAIYVTHMVNPKGIQTLSENYDRVIITNSYKNWKNENIPNNVTVYSVI